MGSSAWVERGEILRVCPGKQDLGCRAEATFWPVCGPAYQPRSARTTCKKEELRLLTIYSPPYVDRIWLWVYYTKIPLYPIFYLLKGDTKLISLGFFESGSD